MRLNAISKSLIATLALTTLQVSALETESTLNGYLKSGLLMSSDGTRLDSLGLFTDYGKFRLGNEQNTKIELLPTIKMTSDEGSWAKVRANLTHETSCTADWNCVDGDEQAVQFREGYVEMGGLDFAPNAVFWAGKRYSSSNTSSHQYDWEYVQYNGTGGGIDGIDVGFAKLDVGMYAFMPSDKNEHPNDPDLLGYADDYSVNAWLKSIAGSALDIQFASHMMAEKPGSKNAATSGLGITALYNFDGFYNVMNGYSRVVFQYGTGLAAGDSLGKNGWGFANSEDTTSSRVVFDGVVNLSQNWEVSTFAFYQMDEEYSPWSDWSQVTTQGYDRNAYAIGVRPHHQITTNFAMQYELGYENVSEDKSGGSEGGLFKATVAPTLMLETGFWARPQIRAFATYSQWDDGVSASLDEGYTRTGSTDTLSFGVQAEVWF
jgi:sucrose porin